MPWVVLKFGGTSVSDVERWDAIGRIAAERARTHRVLIVVSAVSGVTNALLELSRPGTAHDQGFQALLARHRALAAAMGLEEAVLAPHLERLHALHHTGDRRELAWQAEWLAHGELLSSALGAAYLRRQGLDVDWCDARQWLHARALPNQNAWARRLSASCSHAGDAQWRARFDAQPARVVLTQGFIAGDDAGGTVLLGRGGSDTSAAYFGALLGAERVEIWTDVPGMFSANPREVPDARLLARLDHAEAQEIATTGAKVLHPRCIAPCRDARVPIWIRDTRQPHLPGTCIDSAAAAVTGVKAVSRRDGIVLVSMESIGMWQQVGFLADIFERFKRHGLSVDLIGSSETNVTVSLDPGDNLIDTDVINQLSADLAEVCRVKVIAPCTALTLVGRGMRAMMHTLADVLAAFGALRVHLVSQSSNDLNLTFVIDQADAEGMVAKLHAELVRSGAMPLHNAAVFGPSWRALCGDGPAASRPLPWWRSEQRRLLQLAGQATPHYVYHLPTLRARMRMLHDVDCIDRRYYAIKANGHPALLQTVVAGGFGLECVSMGEVRHAFASVPGLQAAQVLFTPSFAPRQEYAQALERGLTVTIDSVEALQRWPELFSGRDVWLRLDLGRGDGHHAKVVTGGAQSKFGLALGRLDAFVREAERIGTRITGLHAHLGSGIGEPAHWREVYAELVGMADAIGTVHTIDIGGGLTIPYRPEQQPFDVPAWARGLAEVKCAHPHYALAIEPGRFLVAECGVLLVRATQVVEKQGVTRVGVDAGMNALMRPALYDAWHDIHNLSRIDADHDTLFDVVGPICESGDVLGIDRPLPGDTAEGDVLVIADAGAYGMVMANRYNLRALPREHVLEGDTDHE